MGFYMRNLVGWRFIIAIALPLLLASLGVLSLTTDLLNRVSDSADQVENARNREIVQRVLKSAENDLARLVRQNATWDEAYANIYPQVNAAWVASTWGSINSVGQSYDRVVVMEQGQSMPLVTAGVPRDQSYDMSRYLGGAHESMLAKLQGRSATTVATSFVQTPDGPAVTAMAPILRATAGDSTATPTRYLVFVRLLNDQLLGGVQARYLVSDLQVQQAAETPEAGLLVNSIDGVAAFGLSWKDRNLGQTATSGARSKASATLGFLILVMTGIAFVCWRLIQNLANNEERALHQARHDPLTELPNRAAMLEKLKAIRAGGQGQHVIAYADLDGFKDVNDSYGHQLGDRLLRAVGTGIARLAGKSVLSSRMGGDEFVVLFSGEAAEADSKEFAEHLLRFLAKPFDIDGRIAFVGASIGIACSDKTDLDELEILRRADIAMYKAKTEGKNRKCMYDASFDVERAEAQSIASELRGIIETKQLEIAFQPVISVRDMRISGVEALARWPQSSSRKVTADRFVAVAETAGLIDDLGELILDKACAAARNWPDLRLAVNISAVQLNNPRFVERAMAIIESHGIPTHRLEFEITETSLIRDADRAKQVFKELQRYGIKVALDDFGTGFSSIGYLRTFSFNRIKIDRSIITKVLSNPAELAIVQGTLLVARGLSAEVTAEGVEKQEEVAVLKLAGCTELQGYYFHKPMPAHAISDLLTTRKAREAERARA